MNKNNAIREQWLDKNAELMEMDTDTLLQLRADYELKKNEIMIDMKKKAELKAKRQDNTDLIGGLTGLAIVGVMLSSFGAIPVSVATMSLALKVGGVSIIGGVVGTIVFDTLKDLAPQKQPVSIREKTVTQGFVPTFAVKKDEKK
ncbi:MAG: hypothetical protein ACRCX2_04245 [Paraclostridium sp.]